MSEAHSTGLDVFADLPIARTRTILWIALLAGLTFTGVERLAGPFVVKCIGLSVTSAALVFAPGPWAVRHAVSLSLVLPTAGGSCVPCQCRTRFAPWLFPEGKGGDTCTNHVCSQAKLTAFVRRAVEEAKAEGLDVVLIATTWQQDKQKDVLSREQDTDVLPTKSACPTTRTAIVTAGDQMGQRRRGGTDRNCCVHGSVVSSPPTKTAQTARKKELYLQRCRLETNRREMRAAEEAAARWGARAWHPAEQRGGEGDPQAAHVEEVREEVNSGDDSAGCRGAGRCSVRGSGQPATE